jgi:hypothetical protein
MAVPKSWKLDIGWSNLASPTGEQRKQIKAIMKQIVDFIIVVAEKRNASFEKKFKRRENN